MGFSGPAERRFKNYLRIENAQASLQPTLPHEMYWVASEGGCGVDVATKKCWGHVEGAIIPSLNITMREIKSIYSPQPANLVVPVEVDLGD